MDKLIGSKINGANSEYGRVESDFYPTPPDVTIALMNYLCLPTSSTIWEPACGEMDTSNAIKDMGYEVISTDIQTGTDFLNSPLQNCDWIITNPPFSLAEKFIRKCNKHNKPFALLLKSQYWNAKKRYKLFQEIRPTYICPLTWRPNFFFKREHSSGSLLDMMWCIWMENEVPASTFYQPLVRPIVNYNKGD